MCPVKLPRPIEYKPVAVRTLLRNMKDFSSLMIDLAFYSIIYNDRELADEVLKLEEYVDTLWTLMSMQASLSVRDADDAEAMVGVLRLATSTDKVSDAAADIAMLVKLGIPPHPAVRASLLSGEEAVSRITVKSSRLADKLLDEVFDELDIALDVIAIRREDKWFLSPGEGFKLEEMDALIVRGPRESIVKLREAAGDEAAPLEERPRVDRVEADVAQALINLKNMSEVMVDLAYLAVITGDRDIAVEVLELEDAMDHDRLEAERLVLQRLKDASPDEVISLMRLILCLEEISDAAAAIASVALFPEVKPHPVLALIVEESDERVIKVTADQKLAGKKLGDLNLDIHGGTILAVKRGKHHYVLPDDEFTLSQGDTLLIKYYEEAAEQLQQLLKAS